MQSHLARLMSSVFVFAAVTALPANVPLSVVGTATSLVQGQPRPIKMVGAGVVMGDPSVPGGAPFAASGVASHLGGWTNRGVLAIDPVTLAATGTVTFVAANGDELEATFDGTFDPATGSAAATFHWSGGTGRFASASGDADFVVQQDPSGAFTFVATGTVTL